MNRTLRCMYNPEKAKSAKKIFFLDPLFAEKRLVPTRLQPYFDQFSDLREVSAVNLSASNSKRLQIVA